MAAFDDASSTSDGDPAQPGRISLPASGGAIRGIGESFAASPVTGTGALQVPLGLSSGRSGSTPKIALAYDSGAGNGPFGLGWQASLPVISRKTVRGLPRYRDDERSDVFTLAGAEDLVPALDAGGAAMVDEASVPGQRIERFRPRVEGAFARIERWTRTADGDVHWRTLSPNNVLAVYGRDAESRVFDPADPRRVQSWLLCETRDDRGEAMVVRYKAEDATGVDLTHPSERSRGAAASPSRTANRYLKRILYGNRAPLLDASGRRPLDLTPQAAQAAQWLFEVVFDYGEHDADDPRPGDGGDWPCRPDPFSTRRAGFEVRTYRLCRRVLMFHHFPEPGVGADTLVRATELGYEERATGTLLTSVRQTGFMRAAGGGYERRSLPPVTFEYSPARIGTHAQELAPGSLADLPAPPDGLGRRWVDLEGEGLAGVLAEEGRGWWYKRNLGDGELGPAQRVGSHPAIANLRGGRQQLTDIDGDGRLELVQLDREPAGFTARSAAGDGWDRFVPFASQPNVDLASPDVRLVDLTGDGFADLVVTEEHVFAWHASLGAEGYAAPERVAKPPADPADGGLLVFSDAGQGLFLADMTGDGLTDLVRIRRGEAAYWPNLGYGRFGAKVEMAGAPAPATEGEYDPRRVRLADVDGSGPADLLYVGPDAVRIWFNAAGNGWTEPATVPGLPHLADPSSVEVADLLGKGTACLVWSSALPADAGAAIRYVDLMEGGKPGLLLKSVNNLGAETRVRYAPSTKFYLADRAAGRPWMTRLPFPVHVVDRVEQVDLINRSRLVSTFTYHHGYYDGHEREFRGFAMVEQRDAEAFADYVAGAIDPDGEQTLEPELFQPPVTTRTWFHTGAHLEAERILHQLRREYHLGLQRTPEPVLPEGLDADELRECARSLKGLPLRQETYGADADGTIAAHPTMVAEHAYEVQMVQRRGEQRHAVMYPRQAQGVTLYYEGDPDDPRVEQVLVLETGPYGNVRKGASVAYGRAAADPALPPEVAQAQARTYVTYSETAFTGDHDRMTPVPAYRLRTSYERRGYEITGAEPAGALFTAAELLQAAAAAQEIGYEVVADASLVRKRLVSHTRTLFRSDALAPLPLGQWDTRGTGHESYRLTFTPGLLAAAYGGEVADAELAAAGYVHLGGDANWWAPSGTALYPADPASHFFRPSGSRSPFGVESTTDYDDYDLLAVAARVVQAPWTEVEAVNDYRVLQPVEVLDANRNRSAVRHDPLGLVVATAVMGKDGAGDGDTLDDPSTEIEHALASWLDHGKPPYVRTRSREVRGDPSSPWHETYAYSNGGGGLAMTKARTSPGPALVVAGDGTVTEVAADPRWVGNGRVVVNNKGLAVKAYEPYFSTTHEYEDERALRTLGTTAIHFYDAIGRNVRTELPDGTLTRSDPGAWSERSHDPIDTVLESRWYADRGSPDPAGPEPLDDPERRAAWLAAQHAGTPATVHYDSLGRAVCEVIDHGGGRTAVVRSELDHDGRRTRLFDELDREVASGFNGPTGASLESESAERGRRWSFSDVLGAEVRSWDEHGRASRTEYDLLRRPVSSYVTEPGQPERLYSHAVYGDRHPQAAERNLRGETHQVFDQSGMSRVESYDVLGNPLRVERVLARDYKAVVDWSALRTVTDYAAVQAAAAPRLQAADTFVAGSSYDALSRVTEAVVHGGTRILPGYDAGGGLATLRVQVEGQGPLLDVLRSETHDASGRRQTLRLGNDVVSTYEYDPATSRLVRRVSAKAGADPATQALQSLSFTYDPVGNVTECRDAAQQTHFFANAVASPRRRYRYDATYQLVEATGREHAVAANDAVRDWTDVDPVTQMPHANDAAAVRPYTETYEYDLLGNLKRVRHAATAGGGSWTRHYRYAYEDDPADRTNRLVATSRPGDPEAGPYTATYLHDAYGNFKRLRLPTADELVWDFQDQLKEVDLGGGGRAYYVYDVHGERVRKVIERQGGEVKERLYLGWVEVERTRLGPSQPPHLERRTIHVSDGTGRMAQIDVKTRDANGTDPVNPLGVPLVRYQYGDAIGSAVFETDAAGAVLSYEEYHPFGTTAYRSSKPGTDLSLKRYRFAGKERDDETGLYHSGARSYAPWLGRWVSADPAGTVDGFCLFRYCRNDPINKTDPTGTDAQTGYLPGTPTDRLTRHSTLEERRAFAERRGLRMIDPNPRQQRWVGTDAEGHWELSRQGRFEAIPQETITFEAETIVAHAPPPQAPPEPPPDPPPQTPPAPAPPEAPPSGSGGSSSGWNRVIGGIQVVGGLLEGIAAVGLLVTPEPTMVTKAGGVLLGAHALDTLVAGARTLWTGEVANTLTHTAGASAARGLGASESTANMVGTGLDIAAGVGPSVAVGISRRAAVTAVGSMAEAGSTTSFGAVAKGAGAEVGEYAARRVIPQATESTCVAAACRMVLASAGRSVPSERHLVQWLGATDEGVSIAEGARVLAARGLHGARFVNKGSGTAIAAHVERAVARRPVLLSVKGGKFKAHAVVLDRIENGMAYIRDPSPIGEGASYSIRWTDLQQFMTGRAVTW